MWKSILFYMTISLIIIYLLHQIWIFLIDTYSEKKINRVFDSQIDQYKEIIENLSKKPEDSEENIDNELLSQDLETFLNTLANA